MNSLARAALQKLLRAGDKKLLGLSTRAPALNTTQLAPYRELRSLKEKEAFEAVMRHAEAVGAVRLVWPKFQPDGAIERVELVDATQLAAVLGAEPVGERLERARRAFVEYREGFPMLDDVLARWERLGKVRDSSPEDVDLWLDACRVVNFCRGLVDSGAIETAVRDASARVFKDSKRIEKLVPQLDVLLAASAGAEARSADEVLQELGLFREPQPARLAGNVVVRRERGAFPLDRPYCALPPGTVLGLASPPSMVLTVENQTTFHGEARARCDTDVLCIYTGGMPSPAWRRMYVALLRDLAPSVPVFHWGDVDEGGYRIAAFLSRAAGEVGCALKPWRMRPLDVPTEQRREAKDATVARMAAFAREAGWVDVATEVEECRFVAEQEGHEQPPQAHARQLTSAA